MKIIMTSDLMILIKVDFTSNICSFEKMTLVLKNHDLADFDLLQVQVNSPSSKKIQIFLKFFENLPIVSKICRFFEDGSSGENVQPLHNPLPIPFPHF